MFGGSDVELHRRTRFANAIYTRDLWEWLVNVNPYIVAQPLQG